MVQAESKRGWHSKFAVGTHKYVSNALPKMPSIQARQTFSPAHFEWFYPDRIQAHVNGKWHSVILGKRHRLNVGRRYPSEFKHRHLLIATHMNNTRELLPDNSFNS